MTYQISERLLQISKPIIKDDYYHIRKGLFFYIFKVLLAKKTILILMIIMSRSIIIDI